jgi:tetratricopeptide (TPR) repeat protein
MGRAALATAGPARQNAGVPPRFVFVSALALFGLGPGCAHARGSGGRGSARAATLDVHRWGPDGKKLYVEAEVGGVPHLFMVDTGASVSVFVGEAAQAVAGRAVPRAGALVGLGGAVPWSSARVDGLQLGPFVIDGLDVAVDVPGVPRAVGLVPVGGILGNDVWSRFQMAIEYPANALELRPAAGAPPLAGAPARFDGGHLSVDVTVEVPAPGGLLRRSLPLDLDTGARGLTFTGDQPADLRVYTTVGEEPVYGVGSGDALADAWRRTLRLPVAAVDVGGARVSPAPTALWLTGLPGGGARSAGLVGHDVLDGHRVEVDFRAGRVHLGPPTRPPRAMDVHAWRLRQLRRADATAATRLERARLLVALGRADEAIDTLDALVDDAPGLGDARVLLARLHRAAGALDAARRALGPLDAGDLADRGELLAVVNDAALRGEARAAEAWAAQAVAARPDAEIAWVALADARRAAGDLPGSRAALREATRLAGRADAHLLRRAWLASLEGDTAAAWSHARRALELDPTAGAALAVYTSLAAPEAEGRRLLSQDLRHALGRLHPGDGPLDFAAAAWAALGEPERAAEAAAAGMGRDCAPMPPGPDQDNCRAWHRALARADLDLAATEIMRALDIHPERAAFLDTRATVLAARGDAAGAAVAAHAAAVRQPDDFYLLFQAARLHALAPGPAALSTLESAR